ncbi:hypothetical protein JZ751_013823 [Albula glossodonta]|uniref:C-type lectin domain-containing protein n=1 Tax=Albula glossodonta TaxID=121402 RepID=A0A8T2NRV1_9TELE|nr:hypothetical protein JZ751_013823 [Albula glossodonta]
MAWSPVAPCRVPAGFGLLIKFCSGPCSSQCDTPAAACLLLLNSTSDCSGYPVSPAASTVISSWPQPAPRSRVFRTSKPPAVFHPAPSASDTEGCERGWKKFHGHCYRYFTHRHTWEDAEKDCREHGGHLASVHTTAEQDFLNGNSAAAQLR